MTACPSCHDWDHPPPNQVNKTTLSHLPREKPTMQMERSYAKDTTTVGVAAENYVSSHTTAGSLAARVSTLARTAPNLELQRAQTSLRHSQFGKELQKHPDKAWTSWLLQSLHERVSIGYTGPRGPRTALNLASAHQHTDIINKEIHKELEAGRVLGPFSSPPLPNLKCSGVGVVPKKKREMAYDTPPISPTQTKRKRLHL